ncbi:hypothetical protein SLS54_008278 [Diplodia seriata]
MVVEHEANHKPNKHQSEPHQREKNTADYDDQDCACDEEDSVKVAELEDADDKKGGAEKEHGEENEELGNEEHAPAMANVGGVGHCAARFSCDSVGGRKSLSALLVLVVRRDD